MRDQRFKAEHRGGPLKKEEHRLLMKWAIGCARHILPLFGDIADARLEQALAIASEWESGKASVGATRQAAFGVLALARELDDPVKIAIARAVMHAVATAHMADHAPGAAEYALKALVSAGQPIVKERRWQDKALPKEIRELVLSSRELKAKAWAASLRKAEKGKKRNA